eukprot:scaffold113756_cov32-Prasinocladus_malaysianus.AAC.1
MMRYHQAYSYEHPYRIIRFILNFQTEQPVAEGQCPDAVGKRLHTHVARKQTGLITRTKIAGLWLSLTVSVWACMVRWSASLDISEHSMSILLLLVRYSYGTHLLVAASPPASDV